MSFDLFLDTDLHLQVRVTVTVRLLLLGLLQRLGVLFPETANVLAKQMIPELVVLVFLVAQGLVDFVNTAYAPALLNPVEEVTSVLVSRVPTLASLSLPVRRNVTCVETNPVGDTLNQASIAGSIPIPLEAMYKLMTDDTEDLCAGGGPGLL